MQSNIEQIQHIYKHSLAGIIGQTIVSIAIVFILFGHVNHNDLLIWGALKATTLLARTLSLYIYRPSFQDCANLSKINQWFYFYRLLMFLSGLLWASSLFFVVQYQPINLLFFFLATFVALSGAAIATLGSVFSIYLGFTIPMLMASVFFLLTSPEPAHFETGLLTIVGFAFLIYAAYKNKITIQALLQRTQDIELAQKDIINCLAMAGEYRDNDTSQHVKRMSYSCYLLALKAGLSEEQSKQLHLASALHDIGKIGISDHILLSSNKLNSHDWEIMKTHTSIGEHILSNHHSSCMKLASKVAAGHHERWDGSGYPKGIANDNIPIEMRIVSICDTFDALISKRPYKEAWPISDALAYIKEESGKHFDPKLVTLFLEIADDVIQYAEQQRPDMNLNIKL